MAGYYFDEQDDTERDCPLIFKYQVPDFAEAIGLASAPSADYKLVQNVVITELAMAAEIGKALSFSRRWGFYKRSRYRCPAFTYTIMMRVVAELVREGLAIEDRTAPGHRGRQSTLMATPALYQAWLGLAPDPVFDPGETIVLRDRSPDRQLLEYVDTPRIRALRDQVQAINDMIASVDLSVPGAVQVAKYLLLFEKPDVDNYGSPIVKRQYVRLTPGNSGRRIFADDFKTHGRFYCPPQNIPSEARRSLRINGEPTDEADYSAMHPTLAYSLAGQRLDGDAYDVGGGFDRKHVKAGMVIAFNAADRKSAVLALAQDQGIDRARANNVISAIFERHRPIERVLCADAGVHLMARDAAIMMGVTASLTADGIPAIPIHDSVLAPDRYIGHVEAKMEEFWERNAGKLNLCSIKRKSASLPHMGERAPVPPVPPVRTAA